MPIRHTRRPDFSSSSRAFPHPLVTPRVYRNIALGFVGLTLVIVAIVFWMSTVKAEIIVKAKRNTAALDAFVDIAKTPDQGQLQGRVVEGVFDNIQDFQVKERSQDVAVPVVATTTGRVRITNAYSKDQPLVKTTRLLTSDGKLFRINATVTVPSGKTVDVAAYSDKPGSEFAIKSGTKFTIPGLFIDLQKWIYAEAITDFVASPTSAGTPAKIVTAADIADAHESLEQSVLDQSKKTLLAEAGIPVEKVSEACTGDQGCWEAIYLVTPMEKKTNASVGQRANTFLAQVKLKVTAVFYPKKDMDLLVRTKLKERLPDGRDLVDFDPSMAMFKIESADAATEKVRMSVKATAASRLTSQSSSLSPQNIAGLTINEAKQKLGQIEGVESVDIQLHPSWARHLPSQKDKIQIRIE